MFRKSRTKPRTEEFTRGLVLFFCLLSTPLYAAQVQLTISSAQASTTYSTYTAAKTKDNSLTTYWRGASGQSSWWLKLDLGSSKAVTQISIWWNKNYGSTNYNIQGSTNNSTWTNLYTALSSAGGAANPLQKDYTLTGTYRYVRIYINNVQNSYPMVYEAKLYATVADDTTPPTGSIKINNDAPYSSSTGVTLTLSAQDNSGGSGVSQMQFSNDNSTWSAAETYATTKSWTLASGDGTKTVYVKYKDAAGNWSSAYSNTILLDTVPPTILINPVMSPTNQNVVLSYSASDNLTPSNEIVVSGDNSPYATEGNYTAVLTANDKAGNTATASTSFSIDKTSPIVVITSPQNGTVVENSQVQLQGTVDGVAFSESRTLTEGENILTKTAVDAAGNSASASVNVYLYLGKLIGPQGGEVLSNDGKVKVVIPQGALNAATQIQILSVKKETLQNATPGGSSLLSVVECKPYGLVFNTPVEIIYSLYQAEIPGTPVELGLYDSIQNKIIPTGQTSTVPTDGYTVSFSLMHFSTYAALKNLTPQSTPIGAGVKIPLPDMFTGAFGHSIPITVPPGRKGMQPGVALNYRSSNSNSWLGLGFSLNPGYIVRSTRLGPPTYIDTQDTFYFVSDAGTTELVWLIDNLYQAKVESTFTKFFKESDDSWRVVGKDGGVLRFGQASNAKETSGQGTFCWYLTKAVEPNGNYIEYQYIRDEGKSYLSRIEYTGNEIGISPTNSVEFFLEPREDVASSYISSAKIATAKRLKEIQVKVNSDLVWRYELAYAYSQDTNRSLLTSITQYASDNKYLPVQRFSYQKAK